MQPATIHVFTTRVDMTPVLARVVTARPTIRPIVVAVPDTTIIEHTSEFIGRE
jgi:hypothetical protein